MTTIYSTRNEAIDREITAALGEYATEHDVDAIADEVLDSDHRGYFLAVGVDEFWTIVSEHAL